jgi:outer membrane protein assembly factor BamA
VERDKIASGIESLRRLYGTRGYLDYVAVPETEAGSNGTLRLTMTITEGTQYRMGKVEIFTGKELAARLRAEWKLPEGAAYDQAYIDKYIGVNRGLLPAGFGREQVRVGMNCPEARVDVQVVVDAAEGASEVKNVPCERK